MMNLHEQLEHRSRAKDTCPAICSMCCKRLRYRLIDGQYVEVHDCPVERATEKGTGQ